MTDIGEEIVTEETSIPTTSRRRSALLWGAVGAISFLVVVQGYLLFGGKLPFQYRWLLAVAVGIGVVSGVISYVLEPRFLRYGR